MVEHNIYIHVLLVLHIPPSTITNVVEKCVCMLCTCTYWYRSLFSFCSGTSQSYANHSISLPTIMRESDNQLFHHGSSQDGLPLSHNIQTGSHDLTSLSHDLHYTHYSESDISSYSDNFPTVFSTHDPTEHAQTSSVTNGYPTPISQAKVTTGYTTEHAHYAHSHHDPPPHDTSSQVTLLTPHTHATGRLEQLEILYDARGRQINQLTSQLTANADDSERHIRILRHEKVQCYNFTLWNNAIHCT